MAAAEDNDQVPARAAAVVAIVVALAAVGAVLWFTRDKDPTPDPTTPVTQTASSATATPTDIRTPTETGPSEIVDGWSVTEVAGITLPVSIEAGPYELSDGRSRGFAPSELGAVMAALHLISRTGGYATPAVFEPTIAEQVVAGDDQQRLLAVAQAAYDQGVRDQGRGDPRGSATARGYRVVVYSDDASTVELWTEASGPNGQVRIGTTVEVVWNESDWTLVPPRDGAWTTQARELALTGQFVEFPPEVR